jgi:hypothetical protein
MRKNIWLIGILGILFFVNSNAQEKPVVKIQMDDDLSEDSKSIKFNHLLKLNPIIFTRGDIPIYYENNFRNNLSVEIGVGLTLRDFLANSSSDSTWFNSFNSNIEEEINIGYSYRIGIRYYSANYGFDPEGLYFSLNYRQQKYSSTLTSVNSVLANNEELSRSNKDVFLALGYVYMLDENAFIDPYIGFGIRTRVYDEVSSLASSYSINNKKDVVPIIVVGLKFAISL